MPGLGSVRWNYSCQPNNIPHLFLNPSNVYLIGYSLFSFDKIFGFYSRIPFRTSHSLRCCITR